MAENDIVKERIDRQEGRQGQEDEIGIRRSDGRPFCERLRTRGSSNFALRICSEDGKSGQQKLQRQAVVPIIQYLSITYAGNRDTILRNRDTRAM